MNTKHLLIASLVGGLISVALVNTPFVNLINLLICAGFWVGPLVAVWLYRRATGSLTMGHAITVGLLAGVWHGLFGLLLSPLGLAGAGSLLNDFGPILSSQDLPALEKSLTGVNGLIFNLAGIAFDIIFGLIGGLMGGAIFRTKHSAIQAGA